MSTKASDIELRKRRFMVAKRLQIVRKQKGMSQVQLAAACECTQGVISQYEGVVLDISLDVLIKISDALGCSMDYLIGREISYDEKDLRGRVLGAFDALDAVSQVALAVGMEKAAKVYKADSKLKALQL
jgi:transcriptional regulator with XRE-family HTH domain